MALSRDEFLEWHRKRANDHEATSIALDAAFDENKAALREQSRWDRQVGLPILLTVGVIWTVCDIALGIGIGTVGELLARAVGVGSVLIGLVTLGVWVRRHRAVERSSARIQTVLDHAERTRQKRWHERRQRETDRR